MRLPSIHVVQAGIMFAVATLKQQFGQRLRDIRIELRMAQDEFAEFIGISRDHVSAIERGVSSPSFEVLELLASRLHLTARDLFDFSGERGVRRRVKLPRRRAGKSDTPRPAR